MPIPNAGWRLAGPEDAMPTVAEMIADAMARKGYSQQRLAKETGLTPAWINMILRRGRLPGPVALIRLADALELDRRTLIRQAHYERAYPAWRPYLEPGGTDDSPKMQIPVIGTASDSGEPGEVALAAAPQQTLKTVGFGEDCRAILVRGDSLEPVAYDGQYVIISTSVHKEDIPDGSIVYVTYELPGESSPRAALKRMYRNRLSGEVPGERALPVYNLIPVNTHLRRKGRGPEPQVVLVLRHRQVREMFPVVGVIFESRTASPQPAGKVR